MGLLDEAIREHLELKRRHGADPTEVERQEQEALGPARRGVATADFDSDAPVSEGGAPFDAEALDIAEDREPDGGAVSLGALDTGTAGAPEAPASSSGGDPLPGDPREPPSGDPIPDDDPREPPAGDPIPDDAPEPPAGDPLPRDDPDEPPSGDPLPADARAGRASAEGDPLPAGPQGPDEGDDVLGATPEFLQETPEHDRLWFEQKPPRDFDF